MYLKRLELQGFKSFADKTVLEFMPGITSVIGPNGSGKSNISDSIRWVLGEQSMKSLRSGKSSDVIFSGTQNRKSLGFAEASLIFDNSDGRLPIEYAKFYLASVITAFDYLHKKNIIYRDLRPQNILLCRNGYIKLAEFGLAKKMENEVTFTMCGTPEYYSPEMLRKSGYNKSHDFWSLGILLYEMLIGCTPFIDSDPLKIYQNILI